MSSAQGADSDLTRKQRRDQARAQRKALEEAERARATRRRRMMQLGGALAVAAIVIVVAIVVSSGGTGSATKGISTGTQANATIASVSSELNGLPQSGVTLGNPKAPVTMLYYGDLECPVCQAFTLNSLPTILQQYVRSGKLKIEYHALRTATPDPGTFQTQQVAALAAGKQNKMWQYVELFYHEQGAEGSGYATESYLTGLANQVPGLNLAAWNAARSDPALTQAVTTDAQTANSQGYHYTPTLIVVGPKGTKGVAGNADAGTIASMIQSVS
jgi:protein-disulfide isomerase